MNARVLRRVSLAFFLVFMTWRGVKHQLQGGGLKGAATVDALCPMGGLEGLYAYASDGIWLQRLAPSSLILLIIIIILTFLLGRIFCGWICPMGAITELSALISSKTGIKK